MKVISEVMFWISNGLLIPVVVGLLVLFVLSVLQLGGLFGARQRYQRRLKRYGVLMDGLKIQGLAPLTAQLEKANGATPFEQVALQTLRT